MHKNTVLLSSQHLFIIGYWPTTTMLAQYIKT